MKIKFFTLRVVIILFAFISFTNSYAKSKNPLKDIKISKRISIDVKDMDVQDLLRMLAEYANLNIVISEKVKGKITLKLTHVPWDQVFKVILDEKELGIEKVGNIWRIVPLKDLKRKEELELKSEKSKEQLEPLVTEYVKVNFAGVKEMASLIKGILTPRGSVVTDTRTSTLIIKDIKRIVNEAIKLVKTLDTPTPQVSIEARIVAIDSNYTRELGIQWGGKYIASRETGNPTGAYFPNSWSMQGGTLTGGTGVSGSNYVVNLPAAVGPGTGGSIALSFANVKNTLFLDFQLSALEDIGKVKTISNPKVTTLDNKTAIIKQGQEMPYSTVSQNGTQTQFKEASLTLEVTPHITPDNNIIMKIVISNDSFGSPLAGGEIPVNKQRITAEMLIKDGNTAVIGGIYKQENRRFQHGVPWLSKIPIIGLLFKKTARYDKRNELLIFITPRIIKRFSS